MEFYGTSIKNTVTEDKQPKKCGSEEDARRNEAPARETGSFLRVVAPLLPRHHRI
ncbi:hypothetical protein HanRHA438_Chr06g0274801 [Helianthus annuus]|nr:hypothetical protein HanRHA438_Chr06g0274801 [Helianthus annuus]